MKTCIQLPSSFVLLVFVALVNCSGYTNDPARLTAAQKAELQPKLEANLRRRCGEFTLQGQRFIAPTLSAMAAAEGGLIRKNVVPLNSAAEAYWVNPGPNQPRLYAEYIRSIAIEKGVSASTLFGQMVDRQVRCSDQAFREMLREFERVRNLNGEVVQTPLGKVSKEKLLIDTLRYLDSQARLTQLTAEFFVEAATFVPNDVAQAVAPNVASSRPSRTEQSRSSRPPTVATTITTPLPPVASSELAKAVGAPSDVVIERGSVVALVAPNLERLTDLPIQQDRAVRSATSEFAQLYSRTNACRFGRC